jgi:hypothetical protein
VGRYRAGSKIFARATESNGRFRRYQSDADCFDERQEFDMGRYLLLWLIGVPLPILFLIWVFGGLH